MIEKFISIRVIIDRIMSREIFKSLQWDNAIRWSIDCFKLINNPEFFLEDIETIDIYSYRGRVPENLIRVTKLDVVEDASIAGSFSRQSTHTNSDPFLKDLPNRNIYNKPYNTIHSYRIEGNIVFTDLEEGKVQIAYTALPYDSNGYVMFPDNVKLIQAIEHYIKYKHFEILNDLGQIPDKKVFEEKQEYSFYVGAAQSEHFLSNLDKVESMINIQSQLLPDRNAHSSDYGNLGNKEYINRY